MNLTPAQFAAAYDNVWETISARGFGKRSRDVLWAICNASFGMNRTHAFVDGLEFFVDCGAVTNKSHVQTVLAPLAEALVIEYHKTAIRRGNGRNIWVFKLRMPISNWRVGKLVAPARIREQCEFKDLLLPDLYDELLATYIQNLRILPKEDGGRVDSGTVGTGRDELQHQGEPDGKDGREAAPSETLTGSLTGPPHGSAHGVSLFVPGQSGGQPNQTQIQKENMDEKDRGSAPTGNDNGASALVDAGAPSGKATLTRKLNDSGNPGTPGGGSAKPVTNLVTTPGGGPAQAVAKMVTQTKSGGGPKAPIGHKVPIEWGEKPVTKMVTSEAVTNLVTPPSVFPPQTPPSGTFNAERSTLNGLWKPVRKKRETERWLMSLLLTELGRDEMTASGGMWRVLVVRNLPVDWIEEGVGEIKRMKAAGQTFTVNPAATLVDILRKRAGVAHINQLSPGPPPI